MRGRQESRLQRLHFEVRPIATGIVTSFNTPAQQERKKPYKKMFVKREKGKREERKEETDLISAPSDQRQSGYRELFVVPCLGGSPSL